MLTLWRRHRSTCKHKVDRYFPPLYLLDVVRRNGGREVHPATRSKPEAGERATQLVRDIEDGNAKAGMPLMLKTRSERIPERPPSAEPRAQTPSANTSSCFSQMGEQAHHRIHLRCPRAIPLSVGKRKARRTRNKKLDRLKAFFRFCHDCGWITANPTKSIKARHYARANGKTVLQARTVPHPYETADAPAPLLREGSCTILASAFPIAACSGRKILMGNRIRAREPEEPRGRADPDSSRPQSRP